MLARALQNSHLSACCTLTTRPRFSTRAQNRNGAFALAPFRCRYALGNFTFRFPSTERAKNHTFPLAQREIIFESKKCDSFVRISGSPLSLSPSRVFSARFSVQFQCVFRFFVAVPFAGSGELCCCVPVYRMTLTVALARIITGFLYTRTHHFTSRVLSAQFKH